jgi:hypothetical protein
VKKRLDGFQKPLDDGKRVEVRLARISYSDDGRVAACSCGKPFTQRREKVREDAIDRHLMEKHDGRGFRL